MRSLWKRQVSRMTNAKQNLQGTGEVFRFTLRQMLRNKANVITLLILMLFALISPFIFALTGESSTDKGGVQAGYSAVDTTIPQLTKEQNDLLGLDVSIDVQSLSGYMDPEMETDDFETRYYLQYGYAMLIIFISILSSSFIIRSVVEEKSSRLVEFMLVSVRPLALLAGKILAIIVYIAGIIILMIVCFSFSSWFCTAILGMQADMASSAVFTLLGRIRLQDAAVILISCITGILTFAILAGLCGAGCSSPEDANGANSVPMILIMGCYLLSIVVSSADNSALNLAASLLPVLSVFCAPVQYMLGNIRFPVLLCAWVIQGAVIVLLIHLASRIYNDLLIYQGTRLKLGRIIRMGIGRKGGASA